MKSAGVNAEHSAFPEEGVIVCAADCPSAGEKAARANTDAAKNEMIECLIANLISLFPEGVIAGVHGIPPEPDSISGTMG